MAKRYGIQIENDGDLSIKDGHIAIGDTLAQNEYILLLSHPGEIKDYPLLGVGIADMIGANDVAIWKRKIRESFKDDGLVVDELSITQEGYITKLIADYGK